MTTACVSFSGGMDSTVALLHALHSPAYDDTITVAFDYGQRHSTELRCAARIAGMLGVSFQVLDAAAIRQAAPSSSLTGDDIVNAYAAERGLPDSFVPGRNAVFFALAAAYGAVRGATALVTGVCANDEAGYPDCREAFVESQELALQYALDLPDFQIDAPLLHLSKAETFQLADSLGMLDLVVEETHTCYLGVRDQRWDWGYGCGTCPSCKGRAEGFAVFRP